MEHKTPTHGLDSLPLSRPVGSKTREREATATESGQGKTLTAFRFQKDDRMGL